MSKKPTKENISQDVSIEKFDSDLQSGDQSDPVPVGSVRSCRTGERSGTLSRRRFLGSMGAVAVAAAVGCKDRSPSVEDVDGGPDPDDDGGIDADGGPSGSEPAQVTGLVQTSATSNSITMTWDAAQNADTYNVYLDGAAEPAKTSITGNGTTLADLQPATTYEVQVAGVNEHFVGPRSLVVEMSTKEQVELGALRAFPGAEGAGALSEGGRGGRVIYVTNLNDDGEGSLRWACNQEGPRIVIFRVGGAIRLKKPIIVSKGYITIAGQTAPGDGIELRRKDPGTLDKGQTWNEFPDGYQDPWEGGGGGRSGGMSVQGDHLVIQNLRIRVGYLGEDTSAGPSCFTTINTGGIRAWHIIVDHCSLSWDWDETLNVWGRNGDENNGCKHITFSNMLCYEGFRGHSCGLLIGSAADSSTAQKQVRHIDCIKSMFSTYNHRMPLICSVEKIRIINNIWYNWRFYAGSTAAKELDMIGNIFKLGNQTMSSNSVTEIFIHPSRTNPGGCDQPRYHEIIDGTMVPTVYAEENLGPYNGTNDYDMVRMGTGCQNNSGTELAPVQNRRMTPFEQPGTPVDIYSNQELESRLLPRVGCSWRLAATESEFNMHGHRVNIRDYHDGRIVDGYINDEGGEQIDHEDNVGGFQEMNGGAPYVCTAEDGIADWWKTRNGLDINTRYNEGPGGSAQVAPEISGLNGWTYMDLYLAGIDVPT